MPTITMRLLGLGLIVFLSGCANLTSIHHKFSSDEAAVINSEGGPPRVKAVSVDAQQRFLVMNFANGVWTTCAEPSPDALSALSAGGGGSVSSNANAAASLAASFAQQAAAFGLRTQSITTLRDEAFRLCEGFASGALDKRNFNVLHRRFLNNMVAELAIEQLTGYARPTVVTLGGGATGTSGGGLPQAQAALDDANKQFASKQDDAKTADQSVADAQAAYDVAQKNSDAATKANSSDAANLKNTADIKNQDLTKAKTDQKAAADNVTEAKKNFSALTTARDAARAVTSGATSSPAQFSVPVAGTAITADVAVAVSKIVHDVLFMDYSKDNCIDLLSSTDNKPGSKVSDEVKLQCIKILEAFTADLLLSSEREKFCFNYLNKEKLDSDVKTGCIKLLVSAANHDNVADTDTAVDKAAVDKVAADKVAADKAAKSKAAAKEAAISKAVAKKAAATTRSGRMVDAATAKAAADAAKAKAASDAAEKAAADAATAKAILDAAAAKAAAAKTGATKSSLPKRSNTTEVLEKYNTQ